MAFVPAPNCAEAVIQYTGPGGIYNNVLNFRFTTAPEQEDLDDLAAIVNDAVGTDFLPLIGTVVNYDGVTVRGLSASVDIESSSDTDAGPGTASGTSMPPNATFCLSNRTGLTGRSARGRFYTVGITATHLASAATVNSTYRNAWIAALVNLRSAAAVAGWTMGVISRQNNNVVLSTAVFRPTTVWIAVDDALDSMRRRLLTRGT